MDFRETALAGCIEIRPPVQRDHRGQFAKPFHVAEFTARGLPAHWAEVFWSTSNRGVIRGFHFQLPPHEHAKLVFCVAGVAFDVALDLRSDSPTYGQSANVMLSAAEGNALLIPAGFGHAFQAVADQTTLMYLVSSVHAPTHDSGVRWDSAGVSWPEGNATVSARDASLPRVEEFISPFRKS